MQQLYNVDAAKKPTNVTVNIDLLQKCKALKLNISATLEQALIEKLAKQASISWVEEHQQAFEVHNKFIEKHGIFGEEDRVF